MSLIDRASQGESAADLLTRIRARGLEVETGRNTASSLAFSAHGLVLRQKETVVTTEYRGLTADAAKKLEEGDSDDTATTIYYHAISESGDYAAVAITTGTKIDYMPRRDDEGDSWICIKTEITYSAGGAGPSSGWTTTRPTVSANGIVVSQSARKTFLTFYLSGRLYQNETVVVREYPFLSLSEAQTKCSELSTSGSSLFDVKLATSWSTVGGITGYKNVTVRGGGNDGSSPATDTTTDMRYEGFERGWTVVATSTTYWGSNT